MLNETICTGIQKAPLLYTFIKLRLLIAPNPGFMHKHSRVKLACLNDACVLNWDSLTLYKINFNLENQHVNISNTFNLQSGLNFISLPLNLKKKILEHRITHFINSASAGSM